MSNPLEKALFQAAVLTFEGLGFMFVSPTLDDAQKAAPADATVIVSFGGPLSGRLVVTVCGDLLSSLAANMLGQEAIPEPTQQYDALGEVANVICGNMLPAIAGVQAVFNIQAPQVQPPSPAPADSEPPSAETHVGLDLGRADLLLFLSDHAA